MAILTGNVCISKTETYNLLTIAENAALSAPAGRQLTLTVDGVQLNIAPGTYTGDVRLTVTEDFGRPGGMGPMTADTGFTAAIRGEDGRIAENTLLSVCRSA